MMGAKGDRAALISTECGTTPNENRQSDRRTGVSTGVPVVRSRELRASRAFWHSPVAKVLEEGGEVRWRDGEPDHGYGVIATMAAGGITDYVAMPLRFTSGEVHSVTFASRAGFSDDQLTALRRLVRPLARLGEILVLRRIARTLLDTYVGRVAGERVLAGRISRGDVETIRAAIWFSDLRGFTELSSRSAPKELVGVLNEVFACQVAAIERQGGEVLKFIGDGLLAIFPFADPGDAPSRCGAALAAADAALVALAACPVVRDRDLKIGLALHVGDVEYGNIGGETRLDFTVIGSAVNLAARLEGITGKLGRSLVVSAEFAAAAAREFEEVGSYELKGIAGAQRVLAPRAV
jgi:adenylate cyclase